MFRRVVSPLILLAGLLAALAHSLAAQTDAWLEVRTPSFSVVTNSTEKDGRRIARQFEQMRAVFHRLYPETDLETATPIVVLAVTDKKILRRSNPPFTWHPARPVSLDFFSRPRTRPTS